MFDREKLLEGINFPAQPKEPFEDRDTLRLVRSAYTGLASFYAELVRRTSGDTRVVVRLLAGDWELRSAGVLESAANLLASFPEAAMPEYNPVPIDAEKLAARLEGCDASCILDAAECVAERSSVCARLVPLGSASQLVRNLFRQCIEAEDLHCAQIAWVRGVMRQSKE